MANSSYPESSRSGACCTMSVLKVSRRNTLTDDIRDLQWQTESLKHQDSEQARFHQAFDTSSARAPSNDVFLARNRVARGTEA